MRISVLITCHNRKAKTLACLDALFNNTVPEGYCLDVFLVDDGSTDGTEQATHEHYPQVNIITGDGSLYWNGGMRVAFAAAMGKGYDYYLWLNDDTLLYPTAIETLVKTARILRVKQGKNVIVVGSAQDPNNGLLTYGGVIRPRKWKATTFDLIAPHDVPVECETMNGNCVLVPNEVAQVVGNMEPKFTHAMGDTDYGLRAGEAGFRIFIAPGFVGTCGRNDASGTFNDRTLPLVARWKKMMQPKGLPPGSWLVFTRRHTGLLWPVFFAWPYVRLLFSR